MTHRVDDVGRCHLGDHGHDIDQSDPLPSQAGRHHLHRELEAHVHGVRSEESSQEEHRDLDNSQLYH